MTQYWQEGEEVFPVIQVVQKAAAILERQSTPIIVAGINISGNMHKYRSMYIC